MFSAGMFSGYLPGAGLSGAVFFFVGVGGGGVWIYVELFICW